MHLVTVLLNWPQFAEREEKTIKAPYGTHGCYFSTWMIVANSCEERTLTLVY